MTPCATYWATFALTILFSLPHSESEVESILSGKVLDTDIPGLEEFMSSESKLFLCLNLNKYLVDPETTTTAHN